jgi:hypothetical protein
VGTLYSLSRLTGNNHAIEMILAPGGCCLSGRVLHHVTVVMVDSSGLRASDIVSYRFWKLINFYCTITNRSKVRVSESGSEGVVEGDI